MTPDPDHGLESLQGILRDFQSFCDQQGVVSEADTRAKLIDRVLREVCGWPEAALTRETHVESGFVDYILKVRNRQQIAVEAKREGRSFVLPHVERRSLKLNGSLTTDAEIKAAISQVRGYCDDNAIRFAVATNGWTWIVFRAVRDDIPWREGTARVFKSLRDIEQDFTAFWNLLSYEAICAGSLDAEFGSVPVSSRQMHRVVDKLFNADAPLRRNRLNEQLQPIIKAIFEDIASQDNLELFRACYVHTRTLRVIAHDLDVVITDAVPAFLKQEGAVQVEQTSDSAGRFGDDLHKSVRVSDGDLYLLLGGIGSGKTTFLRRYQQVLGSDILREKAYWFHIDFLAAPLDPAGLEEFVWQQVLNKVRNHYAGDFLEIRRFVKKVFKDKIAAMQQTMLRHYNEDTEEYEKALSPLLERWQSDLSDYLPRLLQYVKKAQNRAIVFFIDNVDQLNPQYQSAIFLLAQRVTRVVGATTVVALREESYYTASIQRTFTAYTSRKYHIASPHFRSMISQRIRYAIDQVMAAPEERSLSALRGYTFDGEDIAGFLKIVQQSIFSWSKMLGRFIEAICFGNMRMALEMFSTFLTSGASDVSKMLYIYNRDGEYYVSFHEFVKSIMLGDRRYYKDEYSRIKNVFNCTAERNSSHFTGWRILRALLEHRGESSTEGRGYVEIGRLLNLFEVVFDNATDFLVTLDRLVAAQLIEVNTRSLETAAGASHIRVTSAGWYYLRHLAHRFAYLDLVLQDTPISDWDVENALRTSMYDVDNLGDREDNKRERLQVRFDRVHRYLAYLGEEEQQEIARFDLQRQGGAFASPVVPAVFRKFQEERAYIEGRLAENRQRFVEDMPEVDDEDNPPLIVSAEEQVGETEEERS